MMLLAMPEVDELFPVELRVEAALDEWANSESSDSSVLKEFLDVLLADAILVSLALLTSFLIGVGENEEIEELLLVGEF